MFVVKLPQQLQEEVGCDYCTTDPQDLFSDDLVDVVLICTHHDLHVPLAIEAAEAGKQLFVEKPLALTVEGCEQIEGSGRAYRCEADGWISSAILALHC